MAGIPEADAESREVDADARDRARAPAPAPQEAALGRQRENPVTRGTAYVGLGSNLDDPREQIVAAIEAFARRPQTGLVSRSGKYRSAPMGFGTSRIL